MQHHFDIEIAEKYGMLEAVLLNNFYFWIKKNEANKQGFHDGYYWTYNSAKALVELFPYASEYQIRRALKHLQEENLIITGNYNKSAYDRTTWYALTKTAISILQKQQMVIGKNQNGSNKSTTPIPYDNTINNTDNKTDSYIVEQYNSICVSMPRCTKLTDSRRKKVKKRLSENSVDDIILAFTKAQQSDFLSGRNGGWRGCNFDWLMKSQDNITKVLEGAYDNNKSYSKDELELKRAYDSIRSGTYGDGFSFGE